MALVVENKHSKKDLIIYEIRIKKALMRFRNLESVSQLYIKDF